MSYDDYVSSSQDYGAGRHLPEVLVRGALNVVEAEGQIVGRRHGALQIHALPTRILRSQRLRRATRLFNVATTAPRSCARDVALADQRGIEVVFVTCDGANVISAHATERVGGVLASVAERTPTAYAFAATESHSQARRCDGPITRGPLHQLEVVATSPRSAKGTTPMNASASQRRARTPKGPLSTVTQLSIQRRTAPSNPFGRSERFG